MNLENLSKEELVERLTDCQKELNKYNRAIPFSVQKRIKELYFHKSTARNIQKQLEKEGTFVSLSTISKYWKKVDTRFTNELVQEVANIKDKADLSTLQDEIVEKSEDLAKKFINEENLD